MAAKGLPTQLLWTERGLSHLPPDWRQILLFHGFCQSLFLKNAVAVQGIIHYANLRSTAYRTAGLFWPRFRERELELHWLVATSRIISTVIISQSDCRLNNDRCAVLVRTHFSYTLYTCRSRIHLLGYRIWARGSTCAYIYIYICAPHGGWSSYTRAPPIPWKHNCACPIECSTRGVCGWSWA